MTDGRYRAFRSLYEHRSEGIVNVRTAHIHSDGAVEVEGYDLDKDLEKFVGKDEWEGAAIVKSPLVEKLREELRKSFGPVTAKNPDAELLDLIEKGFGGRLSALTEYEKWLDNLGIKHESGLWS